MGSTQIGTMVLQHLRIPGASDVAMHHRAHVRTPMKVACRAFSLSEPYRYPVNYTRYIFARAYMCTDNAGA